MAVGSILGESVLNFLVFHENQPYSVGQPPLVNQFAFQYDLHQNLHRFQDALHR